MASVSVIFLISFPAQAQINSTGDLIFQSSGVQVAKITTAGGFEISKSIKIGNTATACSGTSEGAIRYNSTSKTMEYCDATNWAQMVAIGTASIDATPNIFTFTDVTNQSLGVMTLSNILIRL